MSDSSEFQVERSTTIAAPPAAVYARLVDFHRWREWSPWEELDPTLQRHYSGEPQGTGAQYAWIGNRKAGAGSMEMTHATAPTKVVVEITFLKPYRSTNIAEFTLTETGEGTSVRWLMHGPRTVATRVLGLIGGMDKLIGKDFEKGLAKLRAASEGAQA